MSELPEWFLYVVALCSAIAAVKMVVPWVSELWNRANRNGATPRSTSHPCRLDNSYLTGQLGACEDSRKAAEERDRRMLKYHEQSAEREIQVMESLKRIEELLRVQHRDLSGWHADLKVLVDRSHRGTPA